MKSGIVLQESLAPLTAYANRKAVGLSDFLRRQPNLDIAIPGNRGAQSWLLTTYLDDVSYPGPIWLSVQVLLSLSLCQNRNLAITLV